MKDFSLVSVILPVFNRANLLQRAINSVLIQTYLNWELIIWDDGSTDDTREIAKSYRDDRVKYFWDENHGASYARNRAIAVSQGKYLAFLDSDDEWFKEKLAIQVGILDANAKIDALFSDFIDIIEVTQEKYQTFEQYASVINLLNVEQAGHNLFIIKDGMPEVLAIENFIATDTMIIRRNLLKKTGGFNEELRNFVDFELWWRMGLADACFAYINEVYLTRYKPAGSLSSPSASSYENVIKGLDFCLQETLSKRRSNLVPYLNRLYRNTWQNLISLYGNMGNRKKMISAFFQSLKYGFNLGSIRLLLKSVLGGMKRPRKSA